MERPTTAIVFECHHIEELEFIQQELNRNGIENETTVMETEDVEKTFQIKVDLHNEAKAFACIDAQLLKKENKHSY
jgi:hypothetical protein